MQPSEVAAFVESLRLSGIRLAVEDAKIVPYVRINLPGDPPTAPLDREDYVAIIRTIAENPHLLIDHLLREVRKGPPAEELVWWALGGIRRDQ